MSDETSEIDESRAPKDYQALLTERLEGLFEDLVDLRRSLRDAKRRINAGDPDLDLLKRKLGADMDLLLGRAERQEGKLDDTLQRRRGEAGEFAIDLKEARALIWRRLDKLSAS